MRLLEEVILDARRLARDASDPRGRRELRRWSDDLRENIRSGAVRFGRDDYGRLSLRRLFSDLAVDRHGERVGRAIVEQSDDAATFGENLREAADAVSTVHFSNIIGQISYSTVLDVFDRPEFVAMRLVTTVPASTQHREDIPGIGLIGDVAEDVGEGEDYPRVGLTEEWVTVGPKVKDGFILPITEEAIWEDKTGLLMDRANRGTEAMAITREKEILDAVLGITTLYSRNGGAKQATYANTHTQGTFDNLAASNALVDYTDLDAVRLLFAGMTDPNTGEPVMIGGRRQLVVPEALATTGAIIASATQLKFGADSGSVQMMGGNPLAAAGLAFELISNPYISSRTGSDSTWFYGDFPRAFQYREIWPIQTFALDRNSDLGFNRDIVTQIKVRRKGAPAVVAPWYVVKSTA